MSMIHVRVAEDVARYDRLASMTRYSRAEVEAVYAALLAADAELQAACEAAETVLAPQRVCMGLWWEIEDERYHALEALTLADVPWAQGGNIRHGSETYPLSQWTKAAAAWRGLAKRINREIARLQRTVAA